MKLSYLITTILTVSAALGIGISKAADDDHGAIVSTSASGEQQITILDQDGSLKIVESPHVPKEVPQTESSVPQGPPAEGIAPQTVPMEPVPPQAVPQNSIPTVAPKTVPPQTLMPQNTPPTTQPVAPPPPPVLTPVAPAVPGN